MLISNYLIEFLVRALLIVLIERESFMVGDETR